MNMKVNKRVYVACFCSGTYHNDTEPAHLRIKPELEHIPESVSYQEYAAPESRFCPAKVYEYTKDESGMCWTFFETKVSRVLSFDAYSTVVDSSLYQLVALF